MEEFLNTFNNIFKGIVSTQLQAALLPIKLVLIVFSLLLLISIIYFLFKSSYLDTWFLDGLREYKDWKKKQKEKTKKLILITKENKNNINEAQETELTSTKEINGTMKRTDWERVLDKIETKNELNWKLALIDANKIFDKALFDNNKEFSSKSISNFKDIKKSKNYLEKVLENPEASIVLKDAKKIVKIYEKALKEIKGN